MARTSSTLSNTSKISLEQLDSGSAVRNFPTKYNGDIADLQNKINELVDLLNAQNQVIRDLETRLIATVNANRSEIINTMDQLYVKKTDN